MQQQQLQVQIKQLVSIWHLSQSICYHANDATFFVAAGPLEEGIVRIYTREVLQGLRHLHKKGIMHRDIKGQNVLVDQRGNTKLADFGASTQIHEVMDSVSQNGVLHTSCASAAACVCHQRCSSDTSCMRVRQQPSATLAQCQHGSTSCRQLSPRAQCLQGTS